MTAVTAVAFFSSVGRRAMAQDGLEGMVDDGALAVLPLDGEEPSVQPQIPRPTAITTRPSTQPAAAEAEEKAADTLTGDWFGARPKLAEKGITFDLSAIGDFSHNFAGGLDTTDVDAQYLLNAVVQLETEPLLGWKGGTALASFQHHGGVDPSGRSVGDFQGVSSIGADNRSQLSELWYEQFLGEKFLRLKGGKIDAGGDFALADYAADFLNGGMGAPATQSPLPTYPDPSTGFEAWVYPTDHLFFGAGVFDGAGVEGHRTGSTGPAKLFGAPADLFVIIEGGGTWALGKNGLPGRVRVGGWRATGGLETFSGGEKSGGNGGYVIVDQRLWKKHPSIEGDEHGVTMFVMYDLADPDVFEADHHLAAGVAFTGMFDAREDDSIGLGVTWVHFSDDADFSESSETAIEAYYKCDLGHGVCIQPDLQYIFNPGGAGLDNAFLLTVRVSIAL